MDDQRNRRTPTVSSWPDESDETGRGPRRPVRPPEDEELPKIRVPADVSVSRRKPEEVKPAPAKKRRRRWPRRLLALIVALFLITWLPVLVLRWVNPPTTAYMIETIASLPDARPLDRRAWVPYDQIAPAMRLAAVAGEDQTFPGNHGFDVKAIKAAMQHNANDDTLHGASTITQQTAKNLFLWPGRNYFRKGVEAYFTALIDVTWSKQRVLAVYLNIVQFGPRTFGVEAAAEHYFGKHASQLTAPEAALLAATLPDPIDYDPAHPSAYLQERQSWILEQMRHLGSDYLSSL
ncbi:MAG: monofunctional biosynthetic peptidoglycan transglycosylase [Gammaproteobacteria bacterium]